MNDFDQRMRHEPAGGCLMSTVEHWRTLRGEALETAMLTCRWFVHPNDVIGGWCVMPVDLPPSSGAPEVADFLSRRAAGHITGLHNANLDEV